MTTPTNEVQLIMVTERMAYAQTSPLVAFIFGSFSGLIGSQNGSYKRSGQIFWIASGRNFELTAKVTRSDVEGHFSTNSEHSSADRFDQIIDENNFGISSHLDTDTFAFRLLFKSPIEFSLKVSL